MTRLRRLDLRLALSVLLGLLVTGAALLAWQAHDSRLRADRQLQWQSLGLASYVVQRRGSDFTSTQGAPKPGGLADIGMYISMINPALEAYLLDADGQIVAHTLAAATPARARVDLGRVRALLGRAPAALPVYGDDPRLMQGHNLVSVAPLGGSGYLYIVLRGEQAQLASRADDLGSTRASWLAVLAGALLLGGAVIVAVQRKVTRRLHTLGAQLAAFRNAQEPVTNGNAAGPSIAGDEIDELQAHAKALLARVQQQIQQLEDSDRQRRELISNISHDLHTPLANVRGWLDTLLIAGERLTPEERERHLRTAVRHCTGLSRRVAELFELASLESARTVAHPEPFLMSDLLSDVIQAHQLEAERRGVKLGMANRSDAQARVLADVGLIERVLNNLVDNALRHTAAGGSVELAVVADAQRVTVHVTDTGHGIAQADLPHIFERYWTTRVPGADPAHRPAVSSGLGLAIARRIVELHGGQISVQSQLRRGTEFVVALPALQAARSVITQPA